MFGFRTRRLLSSLAICLALAGNARATNLLVYNPNDSGAGSLRQASVDNRNLGGGNTIIFSNVVTGTITLTTGELSIDTNVTISGPGANALAVSGNHASRVFKIGSNSVVTISGLTITNGYVTAGSGGGIFNYNSTLTVSKCTVAGNSTSAGGFGGGIYSGADSGSATLSVIASTLSGNSASDGSGIYNIGWGTVTVVASTLSGNSASSFGGGIDNNGIGVVNGTKLEIGDSILKAGASGANIYNYEGTVTSDGYNLSSDSGGGFLTALGDQINTDPLLGPL